MLSSDKSIKLTLEINLPYDFDSQVVSLVVQCFYLASALRNAQYRGLLLLRALIFKTPYPLQPSEGQSGLHCPGGVAFALHWRSHDCARLSRSPPQVAIALEGVGRRKN